MSQRKVVQYEVDEKATADLQECIEKRNKVLYKQIVDTLEPGDFIGRFNPCMVRQNMRYLDDYMNDCDGYSLSLKEAEVIRIRYTFKILFAGKRFNVLQSAVAFGKPHGRVEILFDGGDM